MAQQRIVPILNPNGLRINYTFVKYKNTDVIQFLSINLLFIGQHDILDIETNQVLFKKLFNFFLITLPLSLSPSRHRDRLNQQKYWQARPDSSLSWLPHIWARGDTGRRGEEMVDTLFTLSLTESWVHILQRNHYLSPRDLYLLKDNNFS